MKRTDISVILQQELEQCWRAHVCILPEKMLEKSSNFSKMSPHPLKALQTFNKFLIQICSAVWLVQYCYIEWLNTLIVLTTHTEHILQCCSTPHLQHRDITSARQTLRTSSKHLTLILQDLLCFLMVSQTRCSAVECSQPFFRYSLFKSLMLKQNIPTYLQPFSFVLHYSQQFPVSSPVLHNFQVCVICCPDLQPIGKTTSSYGQKNEVHSPFSGSITARSRWRRINVTQSEGLRSSPRLTH